MGDLEEMSRASISPASILKKNGEKKSEPLRPHYSSDSIGGASSSDIIGGTAPPAIGDKPNWAVDKCSSDYKEGFLPKYSDAVAKHDCRGDSGAGSGRDARSDAASSTTARNNGPPPRNNGAMYSAERYAAEVQKWGSAGMPSGRWEGHVSKEGKIDWEAAHCSFNTIPGYSGYIPVKYAQSQYGQSNGDVHKRAAALVPKKPCRTLSENHVMVKVPSCPAEHFRTPAEWTKGYTSKEKFTKEEKPVMTRICDNYSAANIPGYSGYIPGKKSENVMGGNLKYVNGRCKEIFDKREKVGLYEVMAEWTKWKAEYCPGDATFQDPNFLAREYGQGPYRSFGAYKQNSAISTTRTTFNTRYGHESHITNYKPLP